MSSSFPMNHIFWPLDGCGDINIELEWNSDIFPKKLDEFLPSIQLMIECSTYGAFPLEGYSPLHSNLIVKKPLYLATPTKAIFEIEIQYIDYRVMGIFFNLLKNLYPKLSLVKKITIYPTDKHIKTISTTLKKPNFTNEVFYYPPLYKKLGFKVEYSELPKDSHKYRRALIITKEVMSESTIEAYILRINSWISLLNKNSYALPVREPNKATFIADEPEFYDENILELYIPVFETSQLAWFSLINILERASIEISELEGIYIF